MVNKWTPGKWLTVGQTIYALDEQSKINRFSTNMQGGYVNSGSRHAFGDAIVRTDDAELTANAHLIAAAPDLYEALDIARGVMECAQGAVKVAGIRDAISLANAALARARGEAQ